MNSHFKSLWLDELRSGRRRQARHTLEHDNTFCCLGVLCMVIAEDDERPREFAFKRDENYSTACWTDPNKLGTSHHTGELPRELSAWLGISSDQMYKLISLNDTELADFSDIANYIEENL